MSAFPDLPRRFAGTTAYVEEGKGEPLLFIHGVGMRAEAWTPQIAEFSSTHRVIAMDLLGHGQSAVAPRPERLGDYVAQARSLTETLGLSHVTLVGHSLGALVALGFALDHPEATARVAALNAVYCRDAESRRAVEARAAEIASKGDAGDVEVPLKRWFGDASDPRYTDVHAAVKRWLLGVNPEGYAAAYRIFAMSDRAHAGRLPDLAVPALFATGPGDPNSTPAMSQAMAAEAPKARAEIIPGARHMMSLVEVDEVNAMLRRFLESD
ncbi:MAG: alpha/beta fold hydrolase [Parvibaculaceae bacterium]